MSRVLPILFNTEMVRAILYGRKTVTRRALKHPFEVHSNGFITKPKGNERLCPYEPLYQPGDILYVRETWAFIPCIGCDGRCNRGQAMNCYDLQAVEYADGSSISDGCFVYRTDYGDTEDDSFPPSMFKWRPSIHMPKQAARIWLKVTDVRVERLWEMNTGDFLTEGVVIRPEAYNDPENAYQQARAAFIDIWDPTIKQADHGKYSWAANPWVWAIEFERCNKPEEED